MSLSSQLADGVTVLVDTNPIVYFFEGSPHAAPFESLFYDIEGGRIQALVTPITVAELVTGPLRAGKEALAERYRQAVTSGAGFSLREIDVDIAMLAARLRLRHRLKLPDALQLAVAVREGCAALITHDRHFDGVTDIPILGV